LGQEITTSPGRKSSALQDRQTAPLIDLPQCVWPTPGELHILAGGKHFKKPMSSAQLYWLAKRLLDAAIETQRHEQARHT